MNLIAESGLMAKKSQKKRNFELTSQIFVLK